MFNHANKQLLGGGTSVAFYGYKSEDTLAETVQPDYFQYWTELQIGDLVYVACSDGSFIGALRQRFPTLLGPLDEPWGLLHKKPINLLREEAKSLGINSFGLGRDELEEKIREKRMNAA